MSSLPFLLLGVLLFNEHFINAFHIFHVYTDEIYNAANGVSTNITYLHGIFSHMPYIFVDL